MYFFVKIKILLNFNYDHSYDQLSYYQNWVNSCCVSKRTKLTLINFKKLANGIIEDLHQFIMHIISKSIRMHYLKKKII